MRLMGFEDRVLEIAYAKAEAKDMNGLIEYIDGNPGIHDEANKKMDEEPLLPSQAEPQAEPQAQPEADNGPEGKNGKTMQAISGMVSQEFAKMLQDMGFSVNVSEKALLMTGNTGVQGAMAWIEESKTLPDFEEQLFMEVKPKMAPEEIKA
jgi:uncharacterized UBP type Zn finger protein